MRANPLIATGRARQRGTGFIELILVLATSLLVMGGAIVLMQGTRSNSARANGAAALQEHGRRVLTEVLDELRRSGLSTSAGTNYPAIWERARGPESTARGALVATMNYTDVAAVSEVYAWQGDGTRRSDRNAGRVSDEIVFQLPADLDGDGTPLDATGNLEWSADLISWRVVEDANGQPWLARYVERAGAIVDRRFVAPGVTGITFDSVLDDRSMRFGEVAVVLYLEGTDSQGRTTTSAVEGSVVLRNTSEP